MLDAKRFLQEFGKQEDYVGHVASQLKSLEGARPRATPYSPGASQAAINRHLADVDRLRQELAGAKNGLSRTIDILVRLAGELERRSQEYVSDADRYRNAGNAVEVIESKKHMFSAGQSAFHSAKERWRLAEEIRRRVQSAKRLIDAGGEPIFTGGSIDDLFSSAMEGSYVKTPQYPPAVSYGSLGLYGPRTYPNYTPGAYTLNAPYQREPTDSTYYTGGMPWGR